MANIVPSQEFFILWKSLALPFLFQRYYYWGIFLHRTNFFFVFAAFGKSSPFIKSSLGEQRKAID